jgi:hypothetical protein
LAKPLPLHAGFDLDRPKKGENEKYGTSQTLFRRPIKRYQSSFEKPPDPTPTKSGAQKKEGNFGKRDRQITR